MSRINRATHREENGRVSINQGWTHSGVMNHLAAYEDTGLEPADIEELLAAVPRWISVEERLPKKDETVIVYYSWTGQSGTEYRETSLATLEEMRYCGNKLLGCMPLPAPPMEVDE